MIECQWSQQKNICNSNMEMFYGNHSKFGKRSSSVQSLISRGLSLYMVRSQNVI